MISVAHRILDAMLRKENCRLSHEVLVTLMAEVMAIMNARPLVPVSSDPEMPAVSRPQCCSLRRLPAQDAQVKRNEWPTGVIVETIPSRDGRIRKVNVKIIRQGTPKVYSRPVSEVVLLLSKGS